MGSWQFLFRSALWALPAAALPVLLHLLFRRKAPLVEFPTLRFVRSSMQRTAARRRVQRWLLLACRMLLLLLLIFVVAQPVRKLAAGADVSGPSVVAAVVVDTSYSMLLKQGQTTLLEQADSAMQELLRDPALPLHGAKVAVLTSLKTDTPVLFREASQILSPWSPLRAQPALSPLQERVDAAIDLLRAQGTSQKWLVVISDFQRREFVRPVGDFPDLHIIVIDLHPLQPQGAGIIKVGIEELQPQPGIISSAVVEVAARSGDVPRPVTLSVWRLGEKPEPGTPKMANFDAAGNSQVRFGVKLPAGGYLLLTGALAGQENLAWAQERTELLQMPPRRKVTFLDALGQAQAQRFMWLALESYENQTGEKPLEVKHAPAMTGREDVAVVPLTQWPSRLQATSLRNFARAGGTVILALEPGLQDSWATLPADQKQAISELLPADVVATRAAAGAYNPSVVAGDDWLLAGLTDEKFQLHQTIVRQFVTFLPVSDKNVATLLSISPAEPGLGAARPYGLLFRRNLGGGMVYTLATLPNRSDTDLATRYTFLPMMVRMALRPPSQDRAGNVEIGQPLTLSSAETTGINELYVQGPQGDQHLIKASSSGEPRFSFADAQQAGVYQWLKTPADKTAFALTNVQYPAAEAELTYHDPKTLFASGSGVVIAQNAADISTTIQAMNQPQPQWTALMAGVMLLLCVEALMGNFSRNRQELGIKV